MTSSSHRPRCSARPPRRRRRDRPIDDATRTTLDRPDTFSSSVHRRRTRRERGVGTLARPARGLPHIDAGFNADGTVKTPDAPRARLPRGRARAVRADGSLREEYPPRNPYVVAARSCGSTRTRGITVQVNAPRRHDRARHRAAHQDASATEWCAHARRLRLL